MDDRHRIEQLELTRHGFNVAVMKGDAVPPERREACVAQRVEEGVDVMVCHPRLVQTGLDLVEFPPALLLPPAARSAPCVSGRVPAR